MKAAQYKSYGGPEVIEILDTVATPTLDKDQVLVEVHAASVNPIDWKVRAGYLKDYVPVTFPVTIGGDFAGVITQVGNAVVDFKPGDKVYGQGGILNGGSGSFADYVAAKANKIFQKPENIDFLQAAAMPLVGISALQAIEDEIKLQSGQRILIHGGAGGIGNIAIQIAKTHGAYVATTVGTKDIDFTKSLGADEIIDYKTQHFQELLKDYDAVFDTAGGEVATASFQVLKPGGILVSMTGKPDVSLAEKYHVEAIGQSTESNPDRLERLTQLIVDNKIHVNIDKVFSLDQVQEAFTYQETSHPRGKVVIEIKK